MDQEAVLIVIGYLGRTVDELKNENARLKAQLAAASSAPPPDPPTPEPAEDDESPDIPEDLSTMVAMTEEACNGQ